MALFTVAGELLLTALLGVIACKAGLVDQHFGQGLSRLLNDVIIPCYVFQAACAQEDISSLLREDGMIILTAVIALAVLFVVGTIGYSILKGSRGRIIRFGTMFSNALIFGMPIAETYWGDTGLIFLTLFYIPIRIGYYCLPDVLLSPRPAGGGKDMLRRILRAALSPALLACFAGFAFAYAGVQLPAVCMNAVSSVAGSCKPLGMMLIGIIVADCQWKQVCSPGILLMAAYKLLVLPALALAVLALFRFGGIAGRIIVLYTALPSGPLLTTFCIKFDPEKQAHLDSAGLVMLSTMGAVVTVPCWLWVMDRFLP